MAAPVLKQLTPVLTVERIEPCLPFWTALGFSLPTRIDGPDGALVFAILQAGTVEVMYQTRASVIADLPALADELVGHATTLFIQVEDLAAVEQAVQGAPVVRPRHDTFYGSTEIYVREPGGNVVGFAQFG